MLEHTLQHHDEDDSRESSWIYDEYDLDKMYASAPSASHITVLRAARPLTKTFSMENGELKVEPYQMAKHFQATRRRISSLSDLMTVVQDVANRNQFCLIRGVAHDDLQWTPRSNEIFPEPPKGCRWCMLDIDGVDVPDGIDPIGVDAVRYVVGKLPLPFQQASYGYQFSSSAGILNPDGTPRKLGISVHLFFWFSRPIQGKSLVAYLRKHCLDTGFYDFDASGNLSIRYGVDMATINSSSQPHYIANPIIGEGVACVLRSEDRIGTVGVGSDQVVLPELTRELHFSVKMLADDAKTREAKLRGLKFRQIQTRTMAGVSIQRVIDRTPGSQGDVRVGRRMLDIEVEDGRAILKLEGEKTPGSWYVLERNPAQARRFGDDATVQLSDLSADAYAHIRDHLRWFRDIPTPTHHLDANGFLPPLASFMQARLSLVLAPTGCGKTTALADWVRVHCGHGRIAVYVAPRIALVKQMERDLTAKGIPCQSYSDVRGRIMLSSGVVLTTMKSMDRILSLVYETGLPHVLIMDEIHMALDDAMRSTRALAAFEKGLAGAARVVFLTGTLTDLQQRTLSQVIFHAIPALPNGDFASYQFASVKQHPLGIRSSAAFPQDLVTLFQQFQAALAVGECPERTVFILDRAKLQHFRILLREYDLEGIAEVISRKESSDDEIDEAVVSTKPLLITTSLFGVGLNFQRPPRRLWCCFDKIPADTNQIVQTINRANRSAETCEVRIYAGSLDNRRRELPADMAARVALGLEHEATMDAVLEQYFHIDRVVYLMLRGYEKNTAAALGELIRTDGFQNYAVTEVDLRARSETDTKELYQDATAAARVAYAEQIVEAEKRVHHIDEPFHAFVYLNALRQERREKVGYEEPRTDAEIDNDVHGVIMRFCQFSDTGHAKRVDTRKLALLFGEEFPWVSDQYGSQTYSNHGQVIAEKLDGVVEVLKLLAGLQSRELSGHELVARFSRSAALRKGFLALERGDTAYQALFQRMCDLKSELASARGRSSGQRDATHVLVLRAVGELLRPLGVYFEQKAGKVEKGELRTDYDKPVVPDGWDIPEMILNLQAHAERFRALPPGGRPLSLRSEDRLWDESPRKLSRCVQCPFLMRGWCMRGYSVDFQNLGGEGYADECDGFVQLGVRQKAITATRLQEFVAEEFVKYYIKQYVIFFSGLYYICRKGGMWRRGGGRRAFGKVGGATEPPIEWRKVAKRWH